MYRDENFVVFIPQVILSTVWKLRKSTLTLFWQKFRESNRLTKEITKYNSWFDEKHFR